MNGKGKDGSATPRIDKAAELLKSDDGPAPQLGRKLKDGDAAVASAPPDLMEELGGTDAVASDAPGEGEVDAVDALAGMVRGSDSAHFEVVMDIPVRMAVEVGRADISIRHLVQLGHGSLVELDRPAAAPLDIRVNGVLVARGEVVVVNDEKMGVRVTDVVAQAERLKRLR